MLWLALLLAALALPAGANQAFQLVDRSGQPVVVRPGENGQPLLLHFWATWCPECPDDLAQLSEAAAGCDRVRVAAVNAGEDADDVEAFLARHPVRLVVLRDPKGEAWRRLDGRGLPMNAYWSGNEHKTDLGPKTRAQWGALLASLGCP